MITIEETRRHKIVENYGVTIKWGGGLYRPGDRLAFVLEGLRYKFSRMQSLFLVKLYHKGGGTNFVKVEPEWFEGVEDTHNPGKMLTYGNMSAFRKSINSLLIYTAYDVEDGTKEEVEVLKASAERKDKREDEVAGVADMEDHYRLKSQIYWALEAVAGPIPSPFQKVEEPEEEALPEVVEEPEVCEENLPMPIVADDEGYVKGAARIEEILSRYRTKPERGASYEASMITRLIADAMHWMSAEGISESCAEAVFYDAELIARQETDAFLKAVGKQVLKRPLANSAWPNSRIDPEGEADSLSS